ncbi:MAG: GPW/gp25 family protein [Oscillospiraceae bacterium]|nr:GPW/gp25 family protein [Oscillospiraceae bacterium]
MEITILGTDRINWFPKSREEEIINNLRTLISTPMGSVPMNRALGINASFIDDPAPKAIARATISIFEAIQEFEPRVEVVSVDYVPAVEQALLGKFYPRVVVRILDD